MDAAKQWIDRNGFDEGTVWENENGENLSDLLSKDPNVQPVWVWGSWQDWPDTGRDLPAWVFPDDSMILEAELGWDLVGPEGEAESGIEVWGYRRRR